MRIKMQMVNSINQLHSKPFILLKVAL